jgi:S-adenosylmethionine decarboxylase
MINVAGCDSELINDAENIKAFARQLVKDIDMVAYGEPQVEFFALHDPSKSGASLHQWIETSNISGHFVPAFGEIYLDIFSCKSFDRFVARDLVYKFFKAEDHNDNWVLRKAPTIT